MKFTKMHGIGNDYVYVNVLEEKVVNASELSINISRQHFSVGSDGLILIGKPENGENADFTMDIYNADGSRAKMCGNGIRCVGKYVYDHGMTDKTTVRISTLSGIKTLSLQLKNAGEHDYISNSGKVVESATVDMESPILTPELVPVVIPDNFVMSEVKNILGNLYCGTDKYAAVKMPLAINDAIYYGTAVSMGNPHFVTFVDDAVDFPLEDVGPLIEMNREFPDRVNAEFAHVLDSTHITMRVWERGSGETLACGTGACATVVAAVLNKKVEPNTEVFVKLTGGVLKIKWDLDKNTVFMTGPATTSFEGIWF